MPVDLMRSEMKEFKTNRRKKWTTNRRGNGENLKLSSVNDGSDGGGTKKIGSSSITEPSLQHNHENTILDLF